MKVKGHEQWYMWLEISGGYNHTKFEKCRCSNEHIKANVKFFGHGRTASRTNTDDYIDSHFSCESKSQFLVKGIGLSFLKPVQRVMSLCAERTKRNSQINACVIFTLKLLQERCFKHAKLFMFIKASISALNSQLSFGFKDIITLVIACFSSLPHFSRVQNE